MDSSVGSTPPVSRPSRRRAGHVGRVVGVAIVILIVALGAYGGWAYWLEHPVGGRPTLVIYAYSSLFNNNCATNTPIYDAVFGEFARVHAVNVQLECPGGTLVSTLVAEKNAPGADVVIGLDEITGPQAIAAGVLTPYTSPELSHVPPYLAAGLAPDHSLTPYESGYLAIDYNDSFAALTHGAVAHSSFPDFVANSSWAAGLLVENPTTDITGEEFLAWEVEFYTQVLHQDWHNFWRSADADRLPTAPDWGTAFGEFSQATGNPPMVVSYATDPAYAVANNYSTPFHATTSYWNATYYGWRTTYGLGIVRGSPHESLDQQFIDWFLRGGVQSEIPLNEWEYPANDTVALPPVFSNAFLPNGIVALNNGTTPAEVAAALPGWLSDWQSMENAAG
jgi:thiamine transport system substrate-binding protein